MLDELLTGGWLLMSCLIVGEVVWEEEHSTAKLAAECPLRYEVEHSLIRIRSKRWVVEIPIPHEQGIQLFQYRWGQAKAIVGGSILLKWHSVRREGFKPSRVDIERSAIMWSSIGFSCRVRATCGSRH